MLELNKIYLIDCLEGIKKLDAESVDLVITDPPYGDNSGYGRNDKEIANNEHPLLNCSVIFELQRILKPNSAVYNFTNWKHYPFLTEFILRYTNFKIRQLIVLDKNRFGLGYGFRNKHEFLLVLEKGDPKYNFNDFANVQQFKVIEHNEETHPHEKPEDLIRKIIQHSSKEGDLIFDPFVGSGTIMVASKQLNRNFIGFEIDENYVKMANTRLSQKVLFGQLNLVGGENGFKTTDNRSFEK